MTAEDHHEEVLSTARLRDGTRVRLRRIGPADRERLAAGFEKLSPESRYRRFLSPTPRLTEETLRRLTSTDGSDHVAIGAEEIDANGIVGEGLGVARFIRLQADPETAEAAVAVIDEKQGLGLGQLLLETLVAEASRLGVRRFRGHVLRDNAPMRSLLEQYGSSLTVKEDAGFLVYDVALPESPAEELRHGPVYRLFRLAASGVEVISRAISGSR